MGLNVVGLVVLLIFYMTIFLVGVFVSDWKKKKHDDKNVMESSIVAGREITGVVGIFRMTATTVGGGYINGTAESIATAGLVWTLAPFGISVGLILIGLVFARKMRDQKYLTMLDPIQQTFGDVVVFFVYLASLCGDVFWTASILSALGTTLSVIVNLDLRVAIVTSSSVTIIYTMIGQMIAVAYTDILQLILMFGGLVLSVPFVLTNAKIGNIGNTTDVWIGQFDINSTSQWIDLFIAMIFGTIPWQSYFQRVLSVRSGKEARILCIVGSFSALVLVIPPVLIGAAGVSADWTNTSLGKSPLDIDKSSSMLPYVLQEFTPPAVSIIGLGAVCAAVMSSMDSSILGSSSMFTNNIYRQVFRQKAGDQELLWIQRVAVLCVGVMATIISIFVPIIYGLFILAADIVFVIVLPQLFCAVYLKWTNSYGAMVGYIIGIILRIGAGEPYLNLQPFIYYPYYDDESGQNFPLRTFAMVTSMISITVVSITTNWVLYNNKLSKSYEISNDIDSVNNPGKRKNTLSRNTEF